MNEPLIAIDLPTLYYRSFHALPTSIAAPDGTPVNAVRGLLDTLAALVTNLGTARLVAVYDADWRPAFRTAILPEYKAERAGETGSETPPELEVQLPLIRAMVDAAGITAAEVAGTEADDVIGSLSVQARGPVTIVSSDRDLLSLLTPERPVNLYRPRPKGAWQSIGLPELQELYGVPNGVMYRELAALRGDPSDGLPGVPGIGEKTAAKLLSAYGNLDTLLRAAAAGAKADGLSPKRAQALLESADRVRKNIEVMTVRTDLDVAAALATAGTGMPDAAGLRDMAAELGIERSAARLLNSLGSAGHGGNGQAGSGQGGVHAVGSFPTGEAAAGSAAASGSGPSASGPANTSPANPGAANLAAANPALAGKPWTAGPVFAFDLETTGVDPHTVRIVTAALIDVTGNTPGTAPGATRTWLLDPGVEIPAEAQAVHGISTEHARAHGQDATTGIREILNCLADIKAAGGVIVGHNLVYDLTVLQAEATRHNLAPDAKAVCPYVLDTFVLDKQAEKFRKGKRTLAAVAQRWGVPLLDAHNADADALAAAGIAFAIAADQPESFAIPAAALHDLQIRWKAAQAADFEQFLRSKGRQATIERSWPFEN